MPLADEELTRDQLRSRRKRPVRCTTISVRQMGKRELALGRLLYPEGDHDKPRVRSSCAGGVRPCPYVSCRHHLYVDVSPRTGSLKLNFPDLEVWEMAESCALDVADRGGTNLEAVGEIMNLTRERVRQLEVQAMTKLEQSSEARALVDDGGVPVKRRLHVLQHLGESP